jgi:large subunit ribosomal protein L6
MWAAIATGERKPRRVKPEKLETAMSRIGKAPIPVPDKVKVAITGTRIKVEGPKGSLEMQHHPRITVKLEDGVVTVTRPDDDRQNRALHGLTRALVNNMVVGVSTGYEKRLKVTGVGYQAAMKGKAVELTVGFANRVLLEPPAGVTVATPDPTTIVVTGADKQKVGQFAAEVRASKKPEPYKGKGIAYEGEVVRRKEGKTFTK